MRMRTTEREPGDRTMAEGDQDRERRLELLVRRLPRRLQAVVHRLRRPGARWIRIPAGMLLTVGGVFGILPILGFWMLPLGLMLLAEDVPPLRRATDRALVWIEQRRPHWMGLPRTADRQPAAIGKETS